MTTLSDCTYDCRNFCFAISKCLLTDANVFFVRFWDMLHIAMWYRQKSDWSQHSDFVHFGYLVVFLIMHVTSVPRASSPTRGQHHFFECIWPPSNVDATHAQTSGTGTSDGGTLSPPLSPVLSHRKHLVNGSGSGSTAPLSPRQSPRDRSGSGSTSPRKQLSPRLNTAVSFVRSHTQHMLVLREKIPLLLYALSFQDSVTAEHREEMSTESGSCSSNESSLSTTGSHLHKRPAPPGEEEANSDHHHSSGTASASGNRREDSPLFHATMSTNAFDALGLLVAAGETKQHEVAHLSFLFLQRTDEEHTALRSLSGNNSSPSSSSSSSSSLPSSIRCAHVADWMDHKLQLNAVLYPPSPAFGNSMSPTGSSSGSSSGSGSSSPRSPGADIGVIHHPNSISEFSSPSSPTSSPTSGSAGSGSMSGENHHISNPPLQSGLPTRQVMHIDSPHCRDPTVIHGSGCSAFHLLKVHGNGNCSTDEQDIDFHSNLKSLGHLDDDDGELVLLEEHDDAMGDVRQHSGHRKDRGGTENSHLLIPERYGPVLLSNCIRTNLYLLSPYTFASVSSCSDSEVVLGAVAGVVVMSGCERVQLTVACRKLILWNCKDCDLKVATLTPTIVSGDCRGLTFGKCDQVSS